MDLRDRLEGIIAIIELAGRFTVNDQPGMLKDAVAAAIAQGAVHVLLDLHEVQYIDSTRLGELIASHITVTRQGGRLKLVRTPARIQALITMAGLGGVFEGFDSIEAATAALTS